MNPNQEENFYTQLQQYRHTPVDKAQSVTKAYNEVLKFINENFEQKLNIAIEALEGGIRIKQNTMYYKDAETCLDDIEENNNEALKQIKGE